MSQHICMCTCVVEPDLKKLIYNRAVLHRLTSSSSSPSAHETRCRLRFLPPPGVIILPENSSLLLTVPANEVTPRQKHRGHRVERLEKKKKRTLRPLSAWRQASQFCFIKAEVHRDLSL